MERFSRECQCSLKSPALLPRNQCANQKPSRPASKAAQMRETRQSVFFRNYSGTLTSTNWKIFSNFINKLPIYKSFQQQVLKLLSHDTINIPVRGRNIVKSVNALLLRHKII